MNEKLDKIHHTAIQVQNISKAVLWYTQHFKCKIEYQDSSWAMLKFANTSLALVSADQHPYHFAIVQDDISHYGLISQHRDGTSSIYIKDEDGNNVEMLKLPNDKNK
jgi:catechol 2,3-dioxygenase-like lactoylglutathione lyase family enzyme